LVGAVGRAVDEEPPVSHALTSKLGICLSDLAVQVGEERELSCEQSQLSLLRLAGLDYI
jgi:hypothetical protein